MPFRRVLIFEGGFVKSLIFTGAAAALTLFSAPASAQFTGVVVPPRAAVITVDTTPRTLAERRDSVTQINLTNMKEWVDSAAATLGVTATVAVDTVMPTTEAVSAPPTPIAPPPTPTTTEFREGAPAPNTATPVPMLALLGLSSLGGGLWLLRRRRA
jgi:LPXTG-motif cell wall-anchored protein